MSLRLALIQSHIIPDQVQENLSHYEQITQRISQKIDVIIFPELFHCGISSRMSEWAETMEGKSMRFLQKTAQHHQADVVASLLIRKENTIVNRLVWITPEGIEAFYDKRHLFFGDEKKVCTAGESRTIVSRADWNFLPLICYDVRFPIWCKNRYQEKMEYDVLLFIANFPEPRIDVLITLAKARAIENQAYVVIVNRIGKDGNETPHNGKSMIINPIGEIVAEAPSNEEMVLYGELSEVFLRRIRKKFPVYLDWDKID